MESNVYKSIYLQFMRCWQRKISYVICFYKYFITLFSFTFFLRYVYVFIYILHFIELYRTWQSKYKGNC